jgi:broad specificity polyphosphatase/5'/3'-nucleotidase SurE
MLDEKVQSSPGTDLGAVAAGKVAVTPVQLDLTNARALAVLKKVLP